MHKRPQNFTLPDPKIPKFNDSFSFQENTEDKLQHPF